MEFLEKIIFFSLPGGFIGTMVSWYFSRRDRNSDTLAKLQSSIDLLTEKYTMVLDENTSLKQEKAEWQVQQKKLMQKVDYLTKEVQRLKKYIEEGTEK